MKVFIRNVLFFGITVVYGGIGACGKYRDRFGGPWENQEVVLCFTYPPVSNDRLILVKGVELRARANEGSITGENVRFIFFLSPRRNLLVYWLLPCAPHFPKLLFISRVSIPFRCEGVYRPS